jgi:predicted metalloprotease
LLGRPTLPRGTGRAQAGDPPQDAGEQLSRDGNFRQLEGGGLDGPQINAAYQIGDDRLQKKARGQVVPEKFTHGTSPQRMKWFKKGFETADVGAARQLIELDYDKL